MLNNSVQKQLEKILLLEADGLVDSRRGTLTAMQGQWLLLLLKYLGLDPVFLEFFLDVPELLFGHLCLVSRRMLHESLVKLRVDWDRTHLKRVKPGYFDLIS